MSSIADLYKAARQHVGGPLIKWAALGGDGQDSSFETAFSNLAHAYLQDKAPTLLDHELGFQLIDRNQENTKAVGVFAFKVGSQRLFAPVFFLKGELKGHELLYMRNQDLFVPLKESWLNDIMSKKPSILGEGIPRQTSQLGVRQPDLQRLSRAPYKYASAQDFMPVFGHLATQDFGESVNDFAKHCQERLDLGHFLKQASLPALSCLADTLQRRPLIAEAFNRWHGLSVLRDAVKEAQVRHDPENLFNRRLPTKQAVNKNRKTGSLLDDLQKQAASDDKGPDYQQKLEILTFDQSQPDKLPKGLTEEDQQKLLKDTVLIKDRRAGTEVSTPVDVTTEQRLTNPTETGIYKVLTRANKYERCLVIVGPHGPAGRVNMVTVVRLDEKTRNWGNFRNRDVWILTEDESLLPGGTENWKEWFDSLPAGSITEKSKSRYILIGPGRDATCPFKTMRGLGDDSYEAYFSDSHNRPTLPDNLQHVSAAQSLLDDYEPWRDGSRVHLDSDAGTALRSYHGDLYVPTSFKIMQVEPTRADSESGDDSPKAVCCDATGGAESETPPIQPGNISDVTLRLLEKTSSLRVAYSSNRYSIGTQAPQYFRESLISLVRDHGLREDDSRAILKLAQDYRTTRNDAFECLIKRADPYLSHNSPSAPAIPEAPYGDYNPMNWSGPTQGTYQEEFNVPDMSAANTDPMIYNVNPDNMQEPMDVNGVNKAIQSGQKEVFDVSMISSMLKSVRDDTMINRYLPDILKAIDKLGRILFQFYWHQDKFAERYGRQDMPELEDNLRNVFEGLGDLYRFLSQKTIQPYPEDDVQDIDMAAN